MRGEGREEAVALVADARAGEDGCVLVVVELAPLGLDDRLGADVQLWALGTMVPEAQALADRLAAATGLSVGVVNARFAKPLDATLLVTQAKAAKLVVTLEDGAVTGGFGSAVLEELSAAGRRAQVVRLGWPDRFVGHASDVATLRATHGLSPEAMLAAALEGWRRA